MNFKFLIALLISASTLNAQKSIDAPFSQEHMKKDLKLFYDIREAGKFWNL